MPFEDQLHAAHASKARPVLQEIEVKMDWAASRERPDFPADQVEPVDTLPLRTEMKMPVKSALLPYPVHPDSRARKVFAVFPECPASQDATEKPVGKVQGDRTGYAALRVIKARADLLATRVGFSTARLPVLQAPLAELDLADDPDRLVRTAPLVPQAIQV